MALWQLEKEFTGQFWVDFATQHPEIPVCAVACYLVVVFRGPGLLKDVKPFSLRSAFAWWNIFLSLFSLIGSTRTVPVLVHALRAHGFRYTCCQDPSTWYINGPVALWVGLFVFSKIPELLDTVFLVLLKKPVSFLQCYHHSTVLLFCWHAFVQKAAPGLWFASMNYCVHAGMYFYFFLMAVGNRQLVRRVAFVITFLQLLQMVVGCVVVCGSAYHYFYPSHRRGSPQEAGCAVTFSSCALGLGMYASYFVLFAVLFRDLARLTFLVWCQRSLTGQPQGEVLLGEATVAAIEEDLDPALLERRYLQAVDKVNSLKTAGVAPSFTNDDKLRLYALKKVIDSPGQNSAELPPVPRSDYRRKLMRDAWAQAFAEGLSPSAAQTKYLTIVRQALVPWVKDN